MLLLDVGLFEEVGVRWKGGRAQLIHFAYQHSGGGGVRVENEQIKKSISEEPCDQNENYTVLKPTDDDFRVNARRGLAGEMVAMQTQEERIPGNAPKVKQSPTYMAKRGPLGGVQSERGA